ncbi:Pc12g01910 [Penicillium rubens Wisconsin 54-1255]|uniref:Pc12g01910 protein n=1 Tax=Penicillium rubens (strain ATCC 28089 / DSM 1075 / NRRL 1951 / Wisconsin 54-1255) TaxID=500485 RepID=B6GZD4_PENRW|nr:Pc12g01910 [Penicillium rubens Wisconsin 54-1255]
MPSSGRLLSFNRQFTEAFLGIEGLGSQSVVRPPWLDPLMLEGAISSVAVNFANEQITTASGAQGSSIRQVVRNLPSDHQEKMLKNVRAITVDQIKGAVRDILLPMFTLKTANLVVTYTAVLENICFEASGFSPTLQPLKEFEDEYGL